MSLFSVSRYTGDGDESPKKKHKEASAILQKLQEEAKSRRQSSINTDKQATDEAQFIQTEHDASPDISKEGDGTTSPKRAKKRERQLEEDSDKKHSHKKHKKTKSDSINSDKISKEDNESEIPQIDSKQEHSVENNISVDSKTAISKAKKRDVKKNKDKKSKSKDERMDGDVDRAEQDKVGNDVDEESDGDDMPKQKEETNGETGPGSQEIGGFTVIGNIKPARAEKVMRVLPDWLSSPTVLSADLKSGLMPVEEMSGLDPELVQEVIRNGISTFFPVQSQVIPALMNSSATGFLYGRVGYRPSDICVSAPTGSGKTLAFVLPIVQALKSRVSCEVRALAVLPVQNLAIQVFKVFEEYCKHTKLKVGLLIGHKPLAAEQKSLVKRTLRGYKTMYDIIVATPGRLVDHLNKTKGFNLGHLRYLVIDEADRMMDEIKQEWLTQTEAAVHRARAAPTPLTAASCTMPQTPVQKLLYSATLSQNPERLQPLNLFQPKLFISATSGETPPSLEKTGQKAGNASVGRKGDQGKTLKAESSDLTLLSKDDHGKYTTPSELSGKLMPSRSYRQAVQTLIRQLLQELSDLGLHCLQEAEFVVETAPERKPLLVLHMLHHLGYRNILCFTNSVEATHRLSTLIRLYGGIEVTELSSSFHISRRIKIIQKFMSGSIDILICSDMVARGIDIANVKYVISYDPPKFIETHIHRIGRTARAGKEGVALTFLENKECFHFKKILRQAGKKLPMKMSITKKDLKPLLPTYEKALNQLPTALKARVGESMDASTEADPGKPQKKPERDTRKKQSDEEIRQDQDMIAKETVEMTSVKNSEFEEQSIEKPKSGFKKKKRSKKKLHTDL